jgi:hypothetical protein
MERIVRGEPGRVVLVQMLMRGDKIVPRRLFASLQNVNFKFFELKPVHILNE